MKNLILPLILVLFSIQLFAQEDHRSCGTMEHQAYLESLDPTLSAKRNIIEQQTQTYIANPTKGTRTVKHIPVVVHVVYNTTSQNISLAQIQSQINVLNADFRKLNANFANTPLYFQSFASDCEIEFCLAATDPNGQATDGVTRTYTTTTSFTSNDFVKSSATGGHDAWPSNNYLNIWVCKLSNAILGYAQFPGGPAATDGVVIATKAFGTIPGSGLSPVYNKGRTCTHEVGHWLNLFHIWGDDGTSCFGSDLVNDTPNQGGSNYGCSTYPKTTSCSENAHGDMFMNYMDYTDDACMSMFTAGQKQRMEALFAPGGARESLLASTACNSPAPPVNPCGMVTNSFSTNVLINTATIQWTGIANSMGYLVQYRAVNNTNPEAWSSVASSLNNAEIINLLANTTYEYRIQSLCIDGVSDYTPIQTFTTDAQPVGQTCTNNYEPNNSFTYATVTLNNVEYNSMLATSADVDYYKFTTTSAEPKIKVTLSGLTEDYDLKMLKGGIRLMGSSTNSGTANESIVYNAYDFGYTYYVAVIGYNGAFSSTNCYTIKAETSATSFKVEQEALNDENTKPEIVLYPMPVQQVMNANVFTEDGVIINATITNAIGQRVITKTTTAIEGLNILNFETSNLINGLYFLDITYGTERKVQKFVVEQ